jgi:SAM-dependent methyltransferase
MSVTSDWDGYVQTDFGFTDYAPGSRVLDIGFGAGTNLTRLAASGCKLFGIEYDAGLAVAGRMAGLPVSRAKAEQLPIKTASLDGVICKVVLPYTDEAMAVAEIGRVLRPGGIARVAYHGLGYSLRYLFGRAYWKHRVYGMRVVANTAFYRISGRRLPGFAGDTVYQSRRRLKEYYERAGLEILEDCPAQTFLGAPVFIYQTLRRKAALASSSVAA